MNKEEIDINQELEQMRQDYAALKERFNKQQIINKQLIQNAMKRIFAGCSFQRNRFL